MPKLNKKQKKRILIGVIVVFAIILFAKFRLLSLADVWVGQTKPSSYDGRYLHIPFDGSANGVTSYGLHLIDTQWGINEQNCQALGLNWVSEYLVCNKIGSNFDITKYNYTYTGSCSITYCPSENTLGGVLLDNAGVYVFFGSCSFNTGMSKYGSCSGEILVDVNPPAPIPSPTPTPIPSPTPTPPQPCNEGDIKYYTCPDGSQVKWCTCENNNWACIISPETQCEKVNILLIVIIILTILGLIFGLIYIYKKVSRK